MKIIQTYRPYTKQVECSCRCIFEFTKHDFEIGDFDTFDFPVYEGYYDQCCDKRDEYGNYVDMNFVECKQRRWHVKCPDCGAKYRFSDQLMYAHLKGFNNDCFELQREEEYLKFILFGANEGDVFYTRDGRKATVTHMFRINRNFNDEHYMIVQIDGEDRDRPYLLDGHVNADRSPSPLDLVGVFDANTDANRLIKDKQ